MKETIFNTEKKSEKTIKWVLERAQDLFRDNKELILGEPLLCPIRKLQSLTMSFPVLPSYVELADSLVFMSIVFEFYNRTIEKKECERLLTYLVLYRKDKA